jgi:hypothetical protein
LDLLKTVLRWVGLIPGFLKSLAKRIWALSRVCWHVATNAEYSWSVLIRIASFFVFWVVFQDIVITIMTTATYPSGTWAMWHFRAYFFMASIFSIAGEFMIQLLCALEKFVVPESSPEIINAGPEAVNPNN